MPIAINEGENFYCQTFARLWIGDEFANGVEIKPHVWAGRGLPVVPGEHWERWLGEIAFREIRTGLVLTATSPQLNKGMFADAVLKQKLDRLTFGLVLQGVPSYRESFLICGANETGEPDARQFGRAKVFYPTRGMTPLRVGRAELDRAVFLASKLAIIDHQGEDWKRLRRAIDALMRGTAEPGFQDERLHQFVRSLEGLIRPDIARTRAQFIHRSQTFALASSSAVKALEDIFDIRSKIEHLHSPLAMLSGSTTAENEELLYRRARQADRLARFTLSRVLESDVPREVFKTEASTEEFWKKADDEKRTIWGSRMDLDAVQ